MGWTHTTKPQNVKKYLTDLLTFNQNHVLDIAIVNFREMYAAVQNDATGEVWAAIFLLNFVNDKNEEYNFGYKDMDETVGPYYNNCPERILKLLTPLEPGKYPWAEVWRQRCRATLERKKLTRPGSRFRLSQPLKFTDGTTLQDFEVIRKGVYLSLENQGHYRISRINERELEALP